MFSTEHSSVSHVIFNQDNGHLFHKGLKLHLCPCLVWPKHFAQAKEHIVITYKKTYSKRIVRL